MSVAGQKDEIYAAFAEIANGEESARQFCIVLWEFFHLLDDLHDGDQKRSPGEIALVTVAFIETVSANPFFQAHRDLLLGVIRTGAIQWADSERFRAKDGVVDRLTSEILKSGYQDVFFAVAAITGGFPHALRCSEKHRGYNVG